VTVSSARENAPVTDLDTAVDQLHAVPLEDFVAERKRLAKELRAAGDRESAAALAKLPKPSAPAWALNHLAREQPDVVGGWLEAAEALRDASANADKASGDALRAAIAAHRDATRKLLATVRDATRPNGRELSEPMLERVRELLQAATADAERGELLRAGRIAEGDDEPEAAAGERGTKAVTSRAAAGRAGGGGAATGRAAKGRDAGGRAPDTREARAAKEREAREAAARAEREELERLVAEIEERAGELRDAADERAAAAAQADEQLEEARRTLHRSESEAGAAREAADEAAEAAEQAERELRKLTAKLSS
jgi:hypothetical protein